MWLEKLTDGATVQEMLEGFLNSEEYKAMGKSAEDTISDFYNGLLGRVADAEGYKYWMEQYGKGMSLSEIGTHGFLDSDEFLSRDHWMRTLDYEPAMLSRMHSAPAIDGIGGIPEEKVEAFRALISSSLPINTALSPQNLGIAGHSEPQSIVNTNTGGDTNFNISIPIEHVVDYNDLVTKLQHDGKFEKMIQDMTIGQLAGKSSLAKNAYSWKK